MRIQSCPLAVGVLLALLLTASLVRAGDAPTTDSYLDARHLRLEVPREAAALRQTIQCWQVAGGLWNNQSLDGLCLVMVQRLGDDGRPSGTPTVYVSDEATPAQRMALLAAIMAANPELFSHRDSSGYRLEPAVITLEQLDGQTFILHVGLIA